MPALAKKVDLAIRVDPSFQVECQMEVQQGGRRTGAGGGAFILQGFRPRCIWAEAGGGRPVRPMVAAREHGGKLRAFLEEAGAESVTVGAADLQVVGGIHGVNQPFIELPEDLLEKQVGEAFGDLLSL